MKISKKQYERLENYFPKQRGNVKIRNYDFINAILYIAENGCKRRALPKEYGKRYSIYKRFNRWVGNGVIQRIFNANRTEPREYDKELYKKRNIVERLFRWLKGFRRVYTRYDKTDTIYFAFIRFACVVVWLK